MMEVSTNVEEIEELFYEYVKCFENAHAIRKQIEKKNSLLNDADRKQFNNFLSPIKETIKKAEKARKVGELV